MRNAVNMATWLLMLLLAVASDGRATANEDVSEDYFWDEQVDEHESTHVPVFTSKPETFSVMQGETVTLPCFMDKVNGVIIWERDSKTLFTASHRHISDNRFKLVQESSKGSSLEISGVRPEDHGQYVCTVSSSPPVFLKHTVSVKYAPMVETIPENGVLVTKQGSRASLICNATGNPEPTVTWTRKGGVLPGGSAKREGHQLDFGAVDRIHMGNYVCTVENGVGETIIKDFRLEVNFEPEIVVAKSVVHTGAGFEAQLECRVHGQPMPEVTWSREGGARLDPARHQQSHEANSYTLNIAKVVDGDMGIYKCRANNTMSTVSAPIELTGKPKAVVVTSSPNGLEPTRYTIKWSVESYAPIEDYKVIYMTNEANGTGPPVKRTLQESLVAAPPVSDERSVIYKHAFVMQQLLPATAYEAVVTAHNKYGWGAEPRQPFKFSTLGAHNQAAEIMGGEALGSKHPSGAASLRGCLVAALAATVAMLAVL